MDDIRPNVPAAPFRLFDQLRRHMRDGGYAWKTEKTYLHWIRRFVLFHRKQHPARLSGRHVSEFLSHLANERHCSPATQRIALNALIYLYKRFLGIELEDLDFAKAQPKRRLPVVLTHTEVLRILEHLQGNNRLLVELLYGAGLRQAEALSLRVKDLDFELSTITVRSGGRGLRSAHDPKTARTQRRENDGDLHARARPRCHGCAQSTGLRVAAHRPWPMSNSTALPPYRFFSAARHSR